MSIKRVENEDPAPVCRDSLSRLMMQLCVKSTVAAGPYSKVQLKLMTRTLFPVRVDM